MKPSESKGPRLGLSLTAASIAALAILIGCGGSGGPTTGGLTGLATAYPPDSIIFSSTNSGAITVSAAKQDGSGQQMYLDYTNAPSTYLPGAGTFAPYTLIAGDLIVPISNDSSGDSCDLYVTKLSSTALPGSTPVRLTNENWDSVDSLQFSPDGSELLIGASDQTGTEYLYASSVSQTSGALTLGTPRQITAGNYPYLGSDGKTIVYCEQASPSSVMQVAEINLDGSGYKVITSDNAYHYTPQFNKAMTQIVWVQAAPGSGTSGGPRDVWSASIDGQNPVQLTQLNLKEVSSPCFSPDGTAIAFDVWDTDAAHNGLYVIPSTSTLATPSPVLLINGIEPMIQWTNAAGSGF